MLDINYVRQFPDVVRENVRKRSSDYVKLVDDVLKNDELWRKLKSKVDEARSRRNKVSLEINEAKKAGKDASKLVKEAADIPKVIAEAEEKLNALSDKIRMLLLKIPNLMHESVPVGKDESDNKVEKVYGKKPSFSFSPLNHVDLLEKNDWVDTERAAKISGSRWYFLKGDLAVLEMALSRYAVDFMRVRGFNFIVPPFLMSRDAYEGVASLDAFEDVMYKIEGENLYAIATSEHPLTAMFMNEVFDDAKLPVKLVGYSTNFRKEAGTHGKDEKGIFRVHQFNKVEQIIICNQSDSWDFHEELRKNLVEFFESLGLHFRVVNLCSGDIGGISSKTYDVEGWFPLQNAFRELASCSNCTSYQAVRSNIRYQHGNERKHAHTLNSTCVATSRALAAIIENFQNKDGSVSIPEVLHKYAGFKVMGGS